MTQDAADNVAIVTGAGSGVGEETAVLLARAGYAVVLVGRTASRLEATARRITDETTAKTLVLAADLCKADAPRRVVEQTLDRFDRIDVAANIAGAAPLQPIERITPQLWRDNIDINLSAPVLMTAALWPTFRRQRSGMIVNLSSMSSISPFPGFQIYGAAKLGVNLFTRCIAQEGKDIGVRAVAVAPGAVETAMLRANFGEDMIPRDKALSPAAVAGVVRDCITDERPFEPGETIVLDSPPPG